MGRVSKHRRIKSHDPFYRGPRRDNRGMVDLCPVNDDQPVPKSLVRLMKRAESIKDLNNKKSREEVQESRGSGGESAATEQNPVVVGEGKEGSGRDAREEPMFSKRKGESLKSYLERVDVEANARIMETFRKNRKPSERRKRKLEERRKKAVARRQGLSHDRNRDMEEKRDEVRFGEVVQAPPELKAKPRGSQRSSAFPSHPLLLEQTMSASQRRSQGTRSAPRQQIVGLKRKHDLELEREHVISVYRKAKAAALVNRI